MIEKKKIDKIKENIVQLNLSETDKKLVLDGFSKLEKMITSLDYQIQRINIDKNIARNILNSTIDELTQSNTKLTEQNEIIAQQMKFKEVLLANVNHELRTPLNAIIGMGSLLSQTPLTPKQNGYIHIVKRSADNLMTIINDFLTLSSINAGQLELKEELFSIQEYFKELVSINSLKVNDKNIDFKANLDVSIPEYVLGDATRINQVVQNLINNAIKFTHEGQVAIFANLLAEKDQVALVEIIVEDTGIGIPLDRQEEIFESFVQVKETKKDYMGTGLGLNIVKTLVELMKGKVKLESMEGKGSKFIIHLPLRLADEQHKPSSQLIGNEAEFDIPDNWQKKKYLMIEDNPANIIYARELFINWALPLEIATTYQEGLKMATAEYFDVVFSDLKLPDGNGIELLKNLRDNPAAKSGKSIMFMVTASILESDKVNAEKMNIAGYIEKPFVPASLLNNLYKVLERQEETLIDIPKCNILNYNYKNIVEAKLQDLFSNKTNIKDEILGIFRHQITVDIKSIEQGIKEKNHLLLSDVAHKLKSTANMVGIEKLYLLLNELEMMGINEIAFSEIQDKYNEITTLITQVKVDLAPLFSQLPQQAPI